MARSRDLKVGLFVLVGMFLLALVVFLVGEERNLFDPSVTFTTSFVDVQGLKPGAPVRMGGIDVGQVERVGYDEQNPADSTVYVYFWIKQSEAERIKIDTKAKIANKGLLGDKMIELVPGESNEVAKQGAHFEGEKPSDMFGKIEVMATKAEAVIDNIEKATRPLGDEKLHQNIQGSVASVNTILKEVAEGDGYMHKVLSDPQEAERISATIQSLEGTAKEAEGLLKDVRGVVGRVRSGPGFAHDVLYGEGPKGLNEFASAANEVALTLKGVRENESLAHDLLYGGKGDTSQVIKNVADLTGDLKAIVADMRAGKGTIGGLLVDPSIYEDVKVVLGNVQRNDVLRALVRYSINKDEKKPEVQVAGPK
ncbi:MAG: MCE family protein [Polyangiaceae bacterium]|nr:MCE family protein [Polyangiaceae bacterium]